MLQERLGIDQTIDLGQWAAAIGLRRAYLDTLPSRRWAGHLIVLDERHNPSEILRIVLDGSTVRLHFLPPDTIERTGTPAEDLNSLALRLAAALPPEPLSLCTILADRRAIDDLLIAAVADPERAKAFRSRLAAGYGQHWTVRSRIPAIQRIVQSALEEDWRTQSRALRRRLGGHTLIFHRDGAPATRGGVRFSNGQLSLLAPEELISVPGATWVDERLIGEILSLFDQALNQSRRPNALALYAHLNVLLKRGYLRLPNNKPLPSWQLLRGLIQRNAFRWIKPGPATGSPPPPPPPQAASLTLALYFQVGEANGGYPGPGQVSSPAAHLYRLLLGTLARHPQVRATLGWTAAALEELVADAPDVLERYRAGVESGRFETACVLHALPFPLLTSSDAVHAQALTWETIAAQQAQLWARGVVPGSGRLSAGWGEALEGQGYRYAALDEQAIRRVHARFDPTQPVSIEGWPVVGLHRELGQVLRLGVDVDTLADYVRYLAADYAGKTLAVAIRMDGAYADDLSYLGRFLELAEQLGCAFVFLSELASAHAQGTVDVAPDTVGLEAWTSDETSRQWNALFSRAWGSWQAIRALGERIQNRDRLAEETVRRAALDVQCGHRHGDHRHGQRDIAQARQALEKASTLTRRWLLELGSLPTLAERTLGVLRIFEPRDIECQGSMLDVQIPLPAGVSPEAVAFLDQGIVIPSQWLQLHDGIAHFLLAVDVQANAFKDLIVLADFSRAAAEGLDITPHRQCNAWLATLLDDHGQITSIRFQGQERLCGPSNQVRGYLLDAGGWLRPERAAAEIVVASPGPLRGSVTVRQVLRGGVELTRHLHIGLSSPLLECMTELHFPTPQTMAGPLIVGQFHMCGEQASWALPLQAGHVSHPAAQIRPILFAAQDAVDVHTGWAGLRYAVHQATTRAYQYAAAPVPGGMRLGLIASMPIHIPDPTRLGEQPGLGFPGHTYAGRYVYRYALLPLTPDIDARTASYNHPPLWAFYPRHG